MALRPLRPLAPAQKTIDIPSYPTTFTPQQVMAIQALQGAAPKGRTFFDNVKHAVGGPVEWALHQIMRPSWAIASGVEAGIDHKSITHAMAQGFEGKSQLGFGQILQKHSAFFRRHSILRGLAGFGLDVVTDPTSWLLVAAAPATGGASLEPLLAREAGRSAINGFDLVAKSAGHEMAVKHAEDSLKILHEAETAAGGGFSARKALAEHHYRLLTDPMFAGPKAHDTLQALTRAALEEERLATPRVAQLQYRVPLARKVGLPAEIKLTPTSIKGVRVAPKLPSLAKIAEKPGGSLVAKLGPYMIPGWEVGAVAHGAHMTALHIGEHRAGEYFDTIDKLLKPFHKLTQEEKFKALHVGETTPGIVKDHQIDEQVLEAASKKAHLSAAQTDYIRAYHDAGQYLRSKDVQYGIKYDKQVTDGQHGILYVPHPLTGHRAFTTAVKTMLTRAGFEKARKGGATIEFLRNLEKDHQAAAALRKEMGLTRKVEFDPTALMLNRARRGAQKHADEVLKNSLRLSVGVRTRIADPVRLAAALGKKQELLDQWGSLKALHPENHPALLQQHLAEQTARHAKLKQFQTGLSSRMGQMAGMKTDRGRQAAAGRLKDYLAKEQTKIEGKAQKALQKQIDKETAQAQQLRRSLLRTEVEARRAARAQKNPMAEGLPVVKGMRGPLGERYAFTPKIADMIQRGEKLVNDDQTLQNFDRSFGKFISKWKVAVTVINPGYRIRNTMSDVWAMYLSGMPTWAIAQYAAKASKLMIQAKAGNPQALARLAEAYDHGVLSGLFQGDIQQVARATNRGGGYAALLKRKDPRVIAAFVKFAQDGNRVMENAGRLTHYLYRRDFEHLGPAEAAHQVRLAHFDYEDLTPFEQKRFKKLIPFYTWTRKNIPFQVTQLLSRPGRFSAFPKFALEMEHASGNNSNDIVPPWLSSGMAFKTPVGGGAYMVPQIGVTDLAKVEHPMQLIQQVNPVGQLAYEVVTKKNLQTGGDIVGTNPRNPVATSLGPINFKTLLEHLPGADLGQTQRKIGNNYAFGEGINPWYSYAFSQLPITNFIFNQRSSIKRKQRGLKGAAELSYLGGTSFYKLDQDQERLMAELQFRDQMKKVLAGLRGAGQFPEPAQSQPSSYEALIQQLIGKAYGRGR